MEGKVFHQRFTNVSPLRGEKPFFGPPSKNNRPTGMAALRAGLPVTIMQTSLR